MTSPEPPPIPPQRDLSHADVRSLDRHVCPECGGKGEWDPAKKQLVCPYCGNQFSRTSPPPLTSSIVEHDLDEMLARLGTAAKSVSSTERRVKCHHCHAILTRTASTVAQHCDFCGSPELLDYQDISSPIPPESVLPATISQEQAYHALKNFLKSRWLAPSDLKKRNLIDRIHRVYLPYWTFDADAECPWTADSGEYYYVTVNSTDSQGRTVSREERRVRWTPASGHVSASFDDVLVPATGGLSSDILRRIEPFPTNDLVPYETRYVSGWQVEHYQVPLLDGARLGFSLMEDHLRQLCAKQIPGDTYRNLRIQPSFSDKTFKHVLLPIWIAAYQYRGKTWQGAINARTGATYANFPLSFWKIFFIILLFLALIALFILSNR